MGQNDRDSMNEARIIEILNGWFATAEYKLSNVFIFNWESDFFCVTSSGYAIEVEIKISKSDFRADLKKTQKHFLLKNGEKEDFQMPARWPERIIDIKSKCPNRFYYACPEGLIDIKDIPDYAGLLYIRNESTAGWQYHKVKAIRSRFIHKRKMDLSRELLGKYYYMYLNLKNDYSRLVWDISHLTDVFNPEAEPEINEKHINKPTYIELELFNNTK